MARKKGLKRRKKRKTELSVIVPAYNAEKTIGKTIKSLLGQNYPRSKYEIIIVDDGSTDGTVDIVRKFKGVKLILQKHAGPAVARNRGVRNSSGDILLFTDSDCIAGKNWIRNIVKPFENEDIVGVSGTYRTANDKSIISRFVGYEIEARHNGMARQNSIDFVGTFSAAYRKKAFLDFGGFDENFQRASGEDTDLSFKISKSGGLIVFAPNAYVYHHHPETLLSMLKKKFWMGYWRVPLYKKHSDKLFRHSYTPKLVFLKEILLALTCIFSLFGILHILPLELAVFTFAFAILLTLPLSFRIFRKDKIVGALSPLIIILRDFVCGLGIGAGILALLRK
jgi:cellulose synthase/poly-beta-1,6-N-acetylglucosamine synthase-like glycosyltransferase